MRISIRRHGIDLTGPDRSLIENTLRHAVARFEDRVLDVTAYFSDLNGPKGGVDKECRVVVHLRRAGYMAVAETDSSLPRLMDRIADRIGSTIARQAKRERTTKFR